MEDRKFTRAVPVRDKPEPEPYPAFRFMLRAVMLERAAWAHRVKPHRRMA